VRSEKEVAQAERHLAASNARIGAAVAEYYPQVSLSALLGFENLNSGQLFNAASFQPEATAGLRWRLFDFGKVDAGQNSDCCWDCAGSRTTFSSSNIRTLVSTPPGAEKPPDLPPAASTR
jgi:outer membrane efflux protein